MDLGDGTAYLRHHLALAGRSVELFADDAIVRLHRQSNGIPRALNNGATAALIAAAADGKELVDDACAKNLVGRERPFRQRRPSNSCLQKKGLHYGQASICKGHRLRYRTNWDGYNPTPGTRAGRDH